MTQRMNGIMGAALAAAVLTTAASATAQAPEDGRWLPYLGCWVEAGAPPDAPMTCVAPEDDGVALLTVARSGVTERQLLSGDGAERAAGVAGCTGVRQAEFSADGTRLYTSERLTCEGDTERNSRSLIAMVDQDAWIEARALEIAGRTAVLVKRYQPAPASRVAGAGVESLQETVDGLASAIEAARMVASSPITVDAIIEAHARTDAEAVRSWIAEQAEPIDLDAEALVRLADAGVPAEVIDVAIAVSYPERFAVAHAPADGDDYDRGLRRPIYLDPYGYGGWGYDPFYSRYYGSRGYYGWGGYGWNSWGYGSGPTVVVVVPTDGTAAGGRAVKGRGYTRGSAGSAGTASPSMGPRPGAPASARAGAGHTRTAPPKASGSSGSAKAKAKPKGG